MNQYVITAYDYTDADALPRRMNVRPQHIDSINSLKESGNYVIGGAILNDVGKMIGSVMILQFENDEGLNKWKQNEPYIRQKIWERYDIKPFKVGVASQQ